MSVFGMLATGLGLVYSITPLIDVYTAIFKDPNVLQSHSFSGNIIGLACCMIIGSYCGVNGYDECVFSCYIGLTSVTITLFAMAYFKRDLVLPSTLAYVVFTFLSYGVIYLFSVEFTEILVFVINILTCVLFPFDIAEKLLKTRDPSYMHISMNVINVILGLLWGLDYYFKGAYHMAGCNFLCIFCQIIVLFAYLYSLNILDEKSLLIQFSKLWQYILYEIPCSLIGIKTIT